MNDLENIHQHPSALPSRDSSLNHLPVSFLLVLKLSPKCDFIKKIDFVLNKVK